MARRLNIKNLVPRKDAKTRQGYYHLVNPAKYLGDPNKIIFRSGWEKRFATYCDMNERVLAWSSEPLQIPYLHPVDMVTKPYNVDFYVKVKTGENQYKEFIVEVKPARQLKPPTPPSGRVTQKRMSDYNSQMVTYLMNLAKFHAAKEFAKTRNWEFVIVTEQFIF